MTEVASLPGGGMFVMKRDGKQQPVSFDKITQRIASLCEGSVIGCEPLSTNVNPILVAQKVRI
jgi:hypothetical protein